MTLGKFFTLTELKDGLTSPDRVKELVTVMQKEKECVVNNVGDAARVWSTFADVIAVTESKDFLDLFVELDGVRVINKWLDDFQKFGNDSGNVVAGESVIALLRVLERLQIDKHRLVLSGVRETVMNFVGHGDSGVHGKAKDLCDKWVQIQDTEPPVGHEETMIEETEDGVKQVENDEIMDPATKNREPLGPASSPGANDVVESAMKIDLREDEYMVDSSDGALQDTTGLKVDSSTESGSEGDDAKKLVGGQSEDASGTDDGAVSKGSDIDMDAERELDFIEQSCSTSEKLSDCGTGSDGPKRPDSKYGKETEPVKGSAHKHDISAPQVFGAARNSARDILGVDLNDEICFENFPECSVSRACSVSKHQSDCLDIDLNAADGSEDNNVVISGLPSGKEWKESSIDGRPKGSMKLDLDLNSLGDDSFDNVIPDWRLDGRAALLNPNRCQSRSQSSSSSSIQPYIKKIDLNLIDRANFQNDTSLDHQNSIISLFGTQLEVNHRGLGSSMGVYGHTGSQTDPSMCFSPDRPLGAPTSYVLDPRSVQVSHQYVSSSTQVLPFIMNIDAGPSSAPTDAVPLQLNLGLSSGFMVNGGNSEGSSGSIITGKRKEPDSGWDGLQVNYIHKQLTWI